MGTQTNTGFTIIETMLFLGVAGALTVGILVGSGVAINQQRYRDSVNSLKSFIQQQYSEVTNVVNGRDGSEACANAAVVRPPEMVVPQARGTSECMLLGRYVTIDATGKKLTASNVVGYRTVGAPEASSDIAEITTNYTLGTSPIGQETADVAWNAVVVNQKTAGASSPMPISMLILRSPLSGSIMTYTEVGAVTDLKSIVTLANSSTPRNLCVDTFGSTVGGNRMSVEISAYATNQGAIQIPLESTSVCD
jgi:type II secretory pathway pseudopilin PulG